MEWKFGIPNNPESSSSKISKNKRKLKDFEEKAFRLWKEKKSRKLDVRIISGSPTHYYDDDIVETLSERFSDEFIDRITVMFVIGDIIRAFGGVLKLRTLLIYHTLKDLVLAKILTDKKISRKEISEFTLIDHVKGNSLIPFMNGGPEGENWNTSNDGFYDWIDNKSSKFIIGVELGFKADEYGMEVSRKLIKKKKKNPEMFIGILIDGFVSIILQKPPESLDEFQQNTISMINDMKKAGIDIRVNDSWNPLSSDFLAANHIKLWLFDGKAAFYGGIGIESQFIKTLYDQMDLVKGPFVHVLTLMSILLFTNQRRSQVDHKDSITQIYEMEAKKIEQIFLPQLPNEGTVTLKLSMNVPGLIQDAQKDYINLLKSKDLHEVFIMAPYFSDDRIARSLVWAATKLEKKLFNEKFEQIKLENPNLSDEEIKIKTRQELEKSKKIHVIFPKKQENAIIAEISKYYAYYLRNNLIVETKQFTAKDGNVTHEMLHAKQMVVILENKKRNWKKFIKVGGSYNPAGRAHNMWELNSIAFNGNWEQSDDESDSQNPIKTYLDDIVIKVFTKYSEPFPWGDTKFNVSILQRFVMKLAQLLFF